MSIASPNTKRGHRSQLPQAKVVRAKVLTYKVYYFPAEVYRYEIGATIWKSAL